MTTAREHKTHRDSKSHKVPKDDRYEVRLSGSGGHGVILACVMLARAIGTDPRRNVVLTQSYGPEARGGAVRADLVMAKGAIFYPKTMKLDLLLTFTQEACDKYCQDLKPDGLLVVDSTMVTKVPIKNSYGFPFIRLAREKVGHPMVANVIALGAIAELTGIVPREAIRAIVKEFAPKGTEEKNLKALQVGFDVAKKAKRK